MYMCSCNPFSDKTAKEYINSAADRKVRVSEVYRHCSGGEKPQCCSCLPELKDMVLKHNNAVTVKHMNEGLKGAPAPYQPIANPTHTAKPNEPAF